MSGQWIVVVYMLLFRCLIGTQPLLCYVLLLLIICNFQESKEFTFLHYAHQLGQLRKVLISHIRNQKNYTHVIRKKSCSFSGNCGTLFVQGDKKTKVTLFQRLSLSLVNDLSYLSNMGLLHSTRDCEKQHAEKLNMGFDTS